MSLIKRGGVFFAGFLSLILGLLLAGCGNSISGDPSLSRKDIGGNNSNDTVYVTDFTWDLPRFVSGWFVSNNRFYVVEEPLL